MFIKIEYKDNLVIIYEWKLIAISTVKDKMY